MLIPICINAKNEEENILSALDSIFLAKKFSEQRSHYTYTVTILLDDCTDNTLSLCKTYSNEITILESSGGLVSAQRKFVNIYTDSFFYIFSDADIVVDEDSILKISTQMDCLDVEVAYLEKVPIANHAPGILAKALYLYNLHNGYQTKRHYFNGQFFAIRNWNIPLAKEINFREDLNNSYLNLHLGVRCDDIYLSRVVLHRYGKKSIKCIPSNLYYRPPETFESMFRKYQRMVLEIERLNILFPETMTTHNRYGKRKSIHTQALKKGIKIFLYFQVFNFFLLVCKIRLKFDKIYHITLKKEYLTWKPILESKKKI